MSSLAPHCIRCDVIDLKNETLIETFPAWDAPSFGAQYLCRSCLVGAILPVIRSSTEKWEFGQVDRVEPKSSRAFLRFMDGQCEWVVVSSRPFKRYVDFYGDDTAGLLKFFEGDSDASFGEDDASHDLFIDESTVARRRLYFGCMTAEGDGQNIIPAPSSSHPSTATTASSSHQPSPAADEGGTQPSGESLASTLSLSTLETPATTPDSKRSSISSSRRAGGGTELSPKYSQKLWTPEEDCLLLRAIATQNATNVKWSVVARAVPARSGKQCRERYLNHLTPNIKLKNWSPVEDSIIFRLYQTDGSKWSMMAKFIRGRTDNGIKNRYHHMKRRLERQVQLLTESKELTAVLNRLREAPLIQEVESWMVEYAASEIIAPVKPLDASDVDGYLREGCDEICSRCGMMVPSKQTGRLMCKTTGWCEVCVRVSPCISGDILRAVCEARVQ